VVELPSKKQKDFNPNCMATIGIVAGSGRTEKPFYKAGRKFFLMRQEARAGIMSGSSMNAV
jgi:large subunit ribosomal protein L2